MINEAIVSLLLVMGTIFMLLASIGVLRMPDLLMRMHATTKAGTLGAGLVMLGLMVFFQDNGVTARALTIIIFTLLTAPVAAHTIGRAGYFVGIPLWRHMIKDDLKGRYDMKSHRLESRETRFDSDDDNQ